jgi:hypothetical protein
MKEHNYNPDFFEEMLTYLELLTVGFSRSEAAAFMDMSDADFDALDDSDPRFL